MHKRSGSKKIFRKTKAIELNTDQKERQICKVTQQIISLFCNELNECLSKVHARRNRALEFDVLSVTNQKLSLNNALIKIEKQQKTENLKYDMPWKLQKCIAGH